MLIYSGTKESFLADVKFNRLTETLDTKLKEKTGRRASLSERRSWERSLMRMYIIMDDNGIPDNVGVAIEYNVPLTSKRVDFIISGYDERGGKHAEIIELKQWSDAKVVNDEDGIVLAPKRSTQLERAPHPSYQALSYAHMIEVYNLDVQEGSIGLHPCAYVHNYETAGTCALKAPVYKEYLEAAPLFGKREAEDFQGFIKRWIACGDDKTILKQVDNGRLRPSKSLQDVLVSMLEGNAEFMMIDDQKVFYERAMKLVRETKSTGRKAVYIVEGGPGTGKSVIAINMLVALTGEGMVASYVTRNSDPREVYKEMLRGGKMSKAAIGTLFRSSMGIWKKEPDEYDALLVDEAHRLRNSDRFDGREHRNQLANLIEASKFCVFFIDAHQKVTLQDYGTVERIKDAARKAGAEVYQDRLTSQFRCNGSDGFLSWVDGMLGLEEKANYDHMDIEYDFQVLDCPEDLECAIREKNANNKARIVAGYCWEWEKGHRDDKDHHDIVIDGWSKSWNLDNGKRFAIDEDSINEVGCIHTVQGLEFEYVGVIIGPDMRFEEGRIVTDRTKRAATDHSLRGVNKLSEREASREADEIIRNTYRTLMTRGSRGCYVYCVDRALNAYIRKSAGSAY